MSRMTPPVDFKHLKTLGPISDNVRNLWLNHNRAAENETVILWDFKDRLQRATDTPLKTKASIPDSCFTPLGEGSFYTSGDLPLIWLVVSDIVKSSEQYRHEDYTEAHWMSKTVTPLLNLVRRLRRYNDNKDDFEKLDAIDMTTVQMCDSLCPHSPTSLYRDLNKKIDFAMGLHLWDNDKFTLQRSRYLSPGQPPSINQTSSFTNFTPMYLHIELKRPNTDKDPLIQLGAWTAAEFTKRSFEGYDLDMPVLAIDICGDDWNLYLVYARMDERRGKDFFTTQFIGPTKMGDTASLRGVFRILRFLCKCVDWGLESYKAWFKKEVLELYRPATVDYC